MKSKRKILFVLGTRPEAIKMAPLIELSSRDPRFEVIVCSTGQHREMIRPVFEVFGIRPNYDFELMRPGQTLNDITVAVLEKMRTCVQREKPDWVVVQGDTTSAMAASLCAFYERISVAHVEAGLRTGDLWSPWPEEFNRRVTALIARLHFAPTAAAAANLIREGIDPSAIHVTGNTGIDALLAVTERFLRRVPAQDHRQGDFSFLNPRKKLILVTIHRRESFGEPMKAVLRGLLRLAEREDVELMIPLHLNPEVRKAAEEILGDRARWATGPWRSGESSIWLTEPLDYLSFVEAMNRSHFIISDSGGVQEEAPSLGKPVLVVRETTERPEAVEAGTSKLIGPSEEAVVREATRLLDDAGAFASMARTHNPYGDGHASGRILDRIAEVDAELFSGRPALPDFIETPLPVEAVAR